MNVIYYYFYLLYTKYIPDNEPYITAVWAISVCEGFFLACCTDILLLSNYCYTLKIWEMCAFTVFALIVNYFYFIKTGRYKKIIKKKPTFRSSHRLSIIVTVLFFVITFSSWFWGPIYSKHLYQICNQ